MVRFSRIVAAAVLLAGTSLLAQQPAATPPMGWNSWDAYGLTITEQQFRDNVKVLHQKLQPFGYKYAVIDEGWFFYNPEDRNTPDTLRYALDPVGRYVPVPARFPSSAPAPVEDYPALAISPNTTEGMKLHAKLEYTSFTKLAAWVHSQGLLFGIHIVRGIPRASVERNLPIADSNFHAQDAADTTDACPWDPTNWGVKDNAAGQAWYDSLLEQYSGWGIDLLKVDCIADHPYKVDEIRMIRRAIDKSVAKTHRPIVLSLSPGPTNIKHADEVASLANMTRISNDIWDVWANPMPRDFPQDIRGQFARASQWNSYARPGFYPDADMLPFGELRPSPGWGNPRASRLTLEEQRTQLTLWAIARSPLILGANLTLLDAPTLNLLTNKDLLAIDQTATSSSKIVDNGDLVVWRAILPGGKIAVALFNLGDTPILADQGLNHPEVMATHVSLTDHWTHQHLGQASMIAPHGCILLETK
jgi:hypothetical protein